MNSVTKSDIDKDFGQTIKKFRVNAGLTQEQLSEKLGISLKYISRLENGYSGIKTQTLIRCMNILGIEPNILFSKFMLYFLRCFFSFIAYVRYVKNKLRRFSAELYLF